jgi:hypothetical protein
MINSYSNFWRVDPATLPSGNQRRRIDGGPLIDLPVLQAFLVSQEFDLDSLWVATDRCEQDLVNYRWTYEDVVQMLGCLKANDFNTSEWCQVKGGSTVPCDVYVMAFDEIRRQRSTSGFEVYMKFSIDTAGAITLVLVSCHAPR